MSSVVNNAVAHHSLPFMMRKIIQHLYNTPELLLKSSEQLMDVKQRLQPKKSSNSQGSGNAMTNQEASFAMILEEHGIHSIPLEQTNTNIPDGLYFHFQPNGTQRSIDFKVMEYKNNTSIRNLEFDLKHTNGSSIMLNDGWFTSNRIYVITWHNRKIPQMFLSLGQYIASNEEQVMYDDVRKTIKELNSKYKNVGFLRCYIRLANQYNCKKFTSEYTQQQFNNIITFMNDMENIEHLNSNDNMK